MARKTHAQVATEAAAAAIAAERKAIVAYASTYGVQIDALVSKRKLGAEEGDLLKARVRAFAGAVAAGLHVS